MLVLPVDFVSLWLEFTDDLPSGESWLLFLPFSTRYIPPASKASITKLMIIHRAFLDFCLGARLGCGAGVGLEFSG